MKNGFKRIVGLLIALILLVSSADIVNMSADGGWDDGSTDYAPISSGEYGWRTFGFKVYIREIDGKEIANWETDPDTYVGEFLWSRSDGNPGKMVDYLYWSEVPDMYNQIEAKVGDYVKSFPATKDKVETTIWLEYYGVLTHKTNGVTDYYCYSDSGSGTMTMHPVATGRPDAFRQLTDVYDIARDGYGEAYKAYAALIGKPAQNVTLKWDHDQTFYSTGNTAKKSWYPMKFTIWGTNKSDVSGTLSKEGDPCYKW